MQKYSIVSILLFLTLLGTDGYPQDTDLLPLGTSPYRFEIGKLPNGKILNTAQNEIMEIEDIISKTTKTQVYIIGESHISYDCHRFQADFLQALVAQHPKLVVGFEFFKRSDNEVLEQWRLGQISEEELLKATGWFTRQSFHYGYTRMIMNLIRQYRIRTIGLNIPRSVLRRVSRNGYQALSEEEKKLFPTISAANPEHRYLIMRVFGRFAAQVPLWFDRVYTSQKMWDVIMAESMIQALEKYPDHKGIIIAGTYHVAYELGIPFRYRQTRPDARITTLVPVYLQAESAPEEENPMLRMMQDSLEPVAIFSRGIGDFVFAVDQSNDDYFEKIGIAGEMKEGRFRVKRVGDGSWAEKYGIRTGDIIVAVNGRPIQCIEDFESLMYHKFGTVELDFQILRTLPKPEDEEENPRQGEGGLIGNN